MKNFITTIAMVGAMMVPAVAQNHWDDVRDTYNNRKAGERVIHENLLRENQQRNERFGRLFAECTAGVSNQRLSDIATYADPENTPDGHVALRPHQYTFLMDRCNR